MPTYVVRVQVDLKVLARDAEMARAHVLYHPPVSSVSFKHDLKVGPIEVETLPETTILSVTPYEKTPEAS